MLRIKTGIIISSTRQGRFGDKPAAWIARVAARRPELDAEVVDLRDYPMPFFDEAKTPAAAPPRRRAAHQRRRAAMGCQARQPGRDDLRRRRV